MQKEYLTDAIHTPLCISKTRYVWVVTDLHAERDSIIGVYGEGFTLEQLQQEYPPELFAVHQVRMEEIVTK